MNSTTEEQRAAYLAYRREWNRTHKESVKASNAKYYAKMKAAREKAKEGKQDA